MRRSGAIWFSAGVLPFFCALDAAAAPGLEVRAASPLEQVFPHAWPAGTPGATLEAARGEWEPFQIVVRADAHALTDVRASAAPLVGPAGARLAAPRLYRVEYLTVKTPSSVEGHAGLWPDALIPDVDSFVGERRNAFPFAVPAGEARALWVELYVPASTAPGVYRGAVTVRAAGLPAVDVPIALTVHPFVLPRTSSLPVTFGFASAALAPAHGPGGDDPALPARYAVAALRHRISLHGGSMDPPPLVVRPDGTLALDFRAYDAEVGPFLDGRADPDGPSAGARWSAIDLRVPQRLAGETRERYVRAMVAHFRARGWIDRLFDYTFDEPADGQLAEVRARAERLRAAAPEVPRLVTKELTPALAGAVDIWCPVVNFLDDKPGNSRLPPRADYDPRLARGERLWWYQACMSHGCNIIGGDYFTGWPSQAVDAPAIAHRIFEWLTYRYRVGGELYYNTVEAYARGLDPWRNQLLFGGNGDGTLFYPGRPDRIGGRTHIPVESIRLALIREGLEDYEYLLLYERRHGRAAAEAIAASIAPRTFAWQHDPARLFAARHELAAGISAAH
jgi:hypothetical protein